MIEQPAFLMFDSPLSPASLLVLSMELALKSTLLLGGALLVVAAVRRFSSAERHLIVASALFGLLVLPASCWIAPAMELPIRLWPSASETQPQSRTMEGARGAAAANSVADTGGGQIQWPAGGTTGSTPVTTQSSPTLLEAPGDIDIIAWAAGAYGLIAATLLAYVGFSVLRVARLIRSLSGVSDAATLAMADAIRLELGIRRAIRVVAGRSHTPWSWGVARPVVVVPPSFAQWPAEHQRNAIVHELSHIKRFDLLTLLVGSACAALYWLQPLAWIALQRMTREAENACDDLVLREGTSHTGYAEQLLGIANDIFKAGPAPASTAGPLITAMARSSMVGRRIRSVLDPKIRRTTVNRSKILLTFVLSLSVVALLGPLATQSQETPSREAVSRLDDAEFQALVRNGPANSDELRQMVETFLEHDRPEDAVSALVDYISGAHSDSVQQAAATDRECRFCSSVLATLNQGPPGAELAAVLAAFDEVESRAYEAHNGNLLIRLVDITRASANNNALDRGLLYLMEGFRIGNLTDASKLAAVTFLRERGWYQPAKALVEQLHDDASSSLYQSEVARRWLQFLDYEISRESVLADRLLGTEGGAADEANDYLPVVKTAPFYPPEAAAQGREGDVVVEFTVTERGRTRDVTVVSSTDSIFEEAALLAASQFRYVPRVVDGVAVAIPGVRNKITFVME
jgi:TonB family protein